MNAVLKQSEWVGGEQLQQYEQDVANFGDKYIELYSEMVMPAYVHIVVCHSVALLKIHGSIGVHQNQGVDTVLGRQPL